MFSVLLPESIIPSVFACSCHKKGNQAISPEVRQFRILLPESFMVILNTEYHLPLRLSLEIRSISPEHHTSCCIIEK